jgi:hypothetical protein
MRQNDHAKFCRGPGATFTKLKMRISVLTLGAKIPAIVSQSEMEPHSGPAGGDAAILRHRCPEAAKKEP